MALAPSSQGGGVAVEEDGGEVEEMWSKLPLSKKKEFDLAQAKELSHAGADFEGAPVAHAQ